MAAILAELEEDLLPRARRDEPLRLRLALEEAYALVP